MGLLIFFILIVIAVILHEFGHFLAARKLGVIAEEFNIGMGPKMTGKRIGKTSWNLRILPFGGSCVLNDKELLALSPQKRIAIFFAGPVVNLFLSLVCFLAFRLLTGQMNILANIMSWAKMFFISFQIFSPRLSSRSRLRHQRWQNPEKYWKTLWCSKKQS